MDQQNADEGVEDTAQSAFDRQGWAASFGITDRQIASALNELPNQESLSASDVGLEASYAIKTGGCMK